MTDHPLNTSTDPNRVSIRAVLAQDREDVTQALALAGIADPVAIPVQAGVAGGFLGDGITPNLIGILEPDDADDDGREGAPEMALAPAEARPAQSETVMPAPEHGMQALAPVRKRRP
nr:hypothetical protein [uncultured Rhodopila sp.]